MTARLREDSTAIVIPLSQLATRAAIAAAAMMCTGAISWCAWMTRHALAVETVIARLPTEQRVGELDTRLRATEIRLAGCCPPGGAMLEHDAGDVDTSAPAEQTELAGR